MQQTAGQPCPFGFKHLAGSKLQAVYEAKCAKLTCTGQTYRAPTQIKRFRMLCELLTDKSSKGLAIDHSVPLWEAGHDCFCNRQALSKTDHHAKT